MKKIVQTDLAPQAIGPYSQAVKVACSETLYVSGNIPLNPQTMEIVGNTAAEQCKQIMENLGQVLKAGSVSYADVVKTTIYLVDMNDFASVNEVYSAYFQDNPPARATVAVKGLPMGVKIEIDAIAVVS